MNGPVLGFAHRGAPLSRRDDNTLSAFERALRLGAAGIESDIALTADGVPVLVHQGLSVRRPRIRDLNRADLPASVPSLADLYRRCGTDFDLSLDMAAPDAAEAVMQVAEEFGAADRLWLTYWRLPTMEEWRRRWPSVKLVYPALPIRAGRLLGRLAGIGVNVLNVPHRFARPSLAGRAHRHGVLLFAWGVKDRRALERVVARGVDGVFCDDAAALAAVPGARAWDNTG